MSATVTRYVKPLNKKQEGEVRKHLTYLRKSHQALQAGSPPPTPPKDLPDLPDHPWLEGLREMDGGELQDLRMKLFNPKQQPNAQIAETVEIEITIAAGAPTGDREVRLGAALGLTNPMCFRVDSLPEILEPDSDTAAPVLRAPILLNGQILPGEVDRFRFEAGKGQHLQIEARARQLIPYLADAVPGWFQAILTLYDADGRRIACADDYRYHPDPRLEVEIPADGEYELEIRDAIFRGRKDFVYRITVVEAAAGSGGMLAGWAPAADLREEQEPNDRVPEAQSVEVPQWVAGCLDQNHDIDQFTFQGRKDEHIVVEAFARRHLGSPTDALIKLVDASGTVVAWNDDYMEKDGHLHLGPGLLTHHADAYLRTRLPEDGAYYVRMEDAQRHGGKDYTYRLRIAHPQPDFALRVTPSSLTLPAGRTLPVEVYALRRDGFAGEIHLALVRPPPGFVLGGAVIPRGKDRIRVTLTAPRDGLDRPVALQLEGTAPIAGQVVHRAVVPADNTMQAFLWRHLVPARELLVDVRKGKGFSESFTRTDDGPVRIAAGGETTIRLQAPNRPVLKDVRWELVDPPGGLSLDTAAFKGGNLVLGLKAAGEGIETGTRDNLIVGATLNRRSTKGRRRTQKISLGVLPAIPIEIVSANES